MKINKTDFRAVAFAVGYTCSLIHIDFGLYFTSRQGFEHQDEENVADYLIKSLAEKSDSTSGIHKLCSAYETSEYYANTMKFVEKETKRIQFDDAVIVHKYR